MVTHDIEMSIAKEALDKIGVANIASREQRSRIDVLLPAAREIVQDVNSMAQSQKRIRDVGPYEPRTTGDKYFHVPFTVIN
jgi:hypothetical protein